MISAQAGDGLLFGGLVILACGKPFIFILAAFDELALRQDGNGKTNQPTGYKHQETISAVVVWRSYFRGK